MNSSFYVDLAPPASIKSRRVISELHNVNFHFETHSSVSPLHPWVTLHYVIPQKYFGTDIPSHIYMYVFERGLAYT